MCALQCWWHKPTRQQGRTSCGQPSRRQCETWTDPRTEGRSTLTSGCGCAWGASNWETSSRNLVITRWLPMWIEWCPTDDQDCPLNRGVALSGLLIPVISSELCVNGGGVEQNVVDVCGIPRSDMAWRWRRLVQKAHGQLEHSLLKAWATNVRAESEKQYAVRCAGETDQNWEKCACDELFCQHPPVAYTGIAIACKRNRATEKYSQLDHCLPEMSATESSVFAICFQMHVEHNSSALLPLVLFFSDHPANCRHSTIFVSKSR